MKRTAAAVLPFWAAAAPHRPSIWWSPSPPTSPEPATEIAKLFRAQKTGHCQAQLRRERRVPDPDRAGRPSRSPLRRCGAPGQLAIQTASPFLAPTSPVRIGNPGPSGERLRMRAASRPEIALGAAISSILAIADLAKSAPYGRRAAKIETLQLLGLWRSRSRQRSCRGPPVPCAAIRRHRQCRARLRRPGAGDQDRGRLAPGRPEDSAQADPAGCGPAQATGAGQRGGEGIS